VHTVVYLTGGATAVLEGWRESTIDVDLRIEPKSDELMRELVKLKEQLAINIEVTSPPDFIPELPGWRERSPLVLEVANLEVRTFDLYSQALAKIERGFRQDLTDVQSMLDSGGVNANRLEDVYEQIEPEMYRYPAIEPVAFRAKLRAALQDATA